MEKRKKTYKSKLILLFILFALAIGILSDVFCGCQRIADANHDVKTDYSYPESDEITFNRDVGKLEFNDIPFNAWDIKAASAKMDKRNVKPYTIMVYMNGSDLESEYGAATNDLIEMLDSGVNSDYVNLIIFTGGTNRWQNNVISEKNCMLWEIADGRIYQLASIGLFNMGNPGTLASFIDFGIENFPAEKYGLILWDHGGGSIAGYGHDEKFRNGTLSLLKMNYAFEKSMLSKNRLEFIGFDSCLMATVEMAVVASDYARYLVASEDLEPGDGWDYSFLSVLNYDPYMDGAELGIAITDYYMSYYGTNHNEDLTLSVINLYGAARVMDMMGNLMSRCSYNLALDEINSFKTFSKKRNMTKTFGIGSPRDNESDMVDIRDMAYKLSDAFPEEAQNTLEALDNTVVYNRHNSHIGLGGLSAYYVFGGINSGKDSLDIYKSLLMDTEYTSYLYQFYSFLKDKHGPGKSARTSKKGRNLNYPQNDDSVLRNDLTLWQPVENKHGYYIMTGILNNSQNNVRTAADNNIFWPRINGQNVCMYEISDSGARCLYAIPVLLNGKDADIIILFNDNYPQGEILGVRKNEGYIIQKGYDKIQNGDEISFYYQEKYFGNENDESENWTNSKKFTVNESLILEWASLNDDSAYYSFLTTDIHNNKYFSDLQPCMVRIAA